MDMNEGYLLNRTDGGEGSSGSRVSEVTKEKISKGVSANHGHRNGLKESHKARIKQTMKDTRVGSDNPMHGRKHKESTIQKMKEAWKKRERKKWICNEERSLLVPEKDPLPEGYQLGKIYRRENSIPDYRRKKWICNPNYLDDLSDWDGP